jgi:AraC family transcriptional regulator
MGGAETSGPSLQDVIPLLVEVKDHLDGDVSLEALAREFGRSPFHFHRLFSAAVGETPKQHVHRLRLERAAYKLAITDDGVLDVALSVGFRSHETFSRAFKQWSSRSPSEYRRMAKAAQRERLERNRTFRGDGCLISEVRFVSMKPTTLLAIRRVGAYAEFGVAERAKLWTEIVAWAEAAGVALSPLRIGLFPDDPGMTPKALQQADICIPVAAVVTGTGRVRCIELAGGLYGVIEHLGPYETVSQAYRNLADGVRASPYVFREDPPVQVFREVHIGGDPALNRSEVWFPVKRGL